MLQLLYSIMIRPLEYLMDAAAYKLFNVFNSVPVVLMYLSVVVSTVTLPLYLSADKVQQDERRKQKSMEERVRRIRTAFKGDERAMMLQRYYKIAGYHPAYALKGLMPLMIQVPFFIVAYHYIKGLSILNGVSFMDIQDLAYPDGLLVLNGIKINILPVIMTVINWLSNAVYSKNYSLREKLQGYGVSLVFLVLLYNSPSGLVLYWICNNLFSLGKNLYREQIKNKRLFAVSILIFPVLHYIFNEIVIMNEKKLVSSNGYFLLILLLPLLIYILSHIRRLKAFVGKHLGYAAEENMTYGPVILLLTAMTVLYGLVVPAAVTAASPEEFAESVGKADVLFYIGNTFLVYLGLFVVWGGLIFVLSGKKARPLLAGVLSGWLIVSVVNYVFFGKSYGTINADLKYEFEVTDSTMIRMINLIIVLMFFCVAFYLGSRRKKWFYSLVSVIMLGGCAVSFYQILQVNKLVIVDEKEEEAGNTLSRIKIDRNGKNVLFFMIDRAISSYIPYIMAEKPELLESYDGFTYYPDTLSFGWKTIFASGAVFGGYEYTPEAMNNRTDKKLYEKQNEALKLLPVMFGENGYAVTFYNPPYANYAIPIDLSIFDEYPYVQAEYTHASFFDDELLKNGVREQRMRNFVFYSLLRTSARIGTGDLYDKGNYMNLSSEVKDMNIYFVNEYRMMQKLPELTDITDDGQGGLMMLSSGTAHEPCNLQLPDYEPAGRVDNSGFDLEKRVDGEGNIIELGNTFFVQNYSVNMAAIRVLGEYFDYLRSEGVYDNTRIIIVADHGHKLRQIDSLIGLDGSLDIMKYNPLFMVKDFDAKGFTVSDEFMTNADAPLMAVEGIIADPVNPFTGNRLENSAKYGKLHVTASPDRDGISLDKTKTVFYTANAPWYEVYDSALDVNNWSVWKKKGDEGY